MKIIRSVIIFIIFLIYTSCDAPRLNPLDPENPNYAFASIDGVVKTASLPSKAISGVKVLWRNENISVETDANGYFKMDDLPISDGMLVFQKDKYSIDSVAVQLTNKKSQHYERQLNSLPQLDNLIFYTSVQNRYPDDQKDSLFVKAQISDAENDIDSVFIQRKEANIKKILMYNASTQFYESKFSPADLKLNFMDQGIGKDFEIIVKDRSNKIFQTGSSFTIKRIIRQYIQFVSPANSQIVSRRPKFIWRRFLPGFDFKYVFEIYTNENAPKRVMQKSNISQDEFELTLTTDLSPGDYFWVIWCVDDFQNRSSSLPASFVVQ